MTLVGWKGLKGKAVSEVYVFHSVRFNTNEYWNESVMSFPCKSVWNTFNHWIWKRVYTKFYHANTVESD
jgi:hypothetical protein